MVSSKPKMTKPELKQSRGKCHSSGRWTDVRYEGLTASGWKVSVVAHALASGWSLYSTGNTAVNGLRCMLVRPHLKPLSVRFNEIQCVNQENVQSIHSTEPRHEWNFSKAVELHTR